MSNSTLPIAESQKNQKDCFGLVICRWETLRVVFNVILVFVCIVFTAVVDPANFMDPEFWVFLLIGAVLTNVLFMLGPALDGYLTWYGIWSAPFAMLMFIAGTIFTTYHALDWIGSY